MAIAAIVGTSMRTLPVNSVDALGCHRTFIALP
jgi:hypothetical protein